MKRLFLFFLLIGISCGMAFAQVDLSVKVLDVSLGETQSGLTVELRNDAIGFLSEQTTNESGIALFPALPVAGSYSLRVPANDIYFEVIETGITLRANTDRNITLLLLQKAEFDLEEVTISGASISRINTVNAEVSSELTRSEIIALPIEGRDITRALYRLPNVTQATGFYPEAPNVAINGANSLYTNYLIDGLDNNERFLGGQKFNIPIGFVQNINVLTNSFSTEYGLSGNGVINITSRSGSNETTGEAFFLTRPGPVIDGNSPYAQRDLSGNFVKDGFARYQGGFGLGGAITKDKTFYYINAEYTRDVKDNLLRVPELGINETVRGANDFLYLSAKVDHLWNKRWLSSIRVNNGMIDIDRQGGGLEGGATFPSAGNQQSRNSLLIASKNSYRSDRFAYEANFQYSRFDWNYAQPNNPNSPQVTVRGPGELTLAVLGHPGFAFDQTENTFQVQQKISYYLNRHTLKAGAQVLTSSHDLFGGGNPNGNYTVDLTQNQVDALAQTASSALQPTDLNALPGAIDVVGYSTELRPTSFGARQTILSAYIEDAFALTPTFKATLGLRYDYDNLSKGGAETGDFNNIAPRFSFNWQLDERSTLRGGAGLFYEKIVYALYSDALQQSTTSPVFRAQLQELINEGLLPADTDLDRVTFDGNLPAFSDNVPYLGGPTADELRDQRANAFSNERRILNPNGYDNPYTWQFSLGYQRQLSANTLFYVDVMHNRGENLFRLRDVNAPAPYPIDPEDVEVRPQEEADLVRPVPVVSNDDGTFVQIDGQLVQGGARRVTITETEGRSRYYAMSLNLVKERNKDDFAYRLNYTLSSLRNNTEDINFTAVDANDFEAEWGPSINDRTHVINGIVYYFPTRNLTLTLAALLQSGQPINRIPLAELYGTTDLNGDGLSFGNAYVGNSDRSPGETRNSDRLPWSNTFDVGLLYRIPTQENTNNFFELSADVFNLFNAVNLSGYSNNATQSNQIQAGPASSGLLVRRNAAPPRQFQFGARYVF